jgi:toxin FitB
VKYLLDTNIISEARKPDGHPAIRQALQTIDDKDLFLSVVTVGEIVKGVSALDPGKKRTELESWLAQTEKHFADRLLAIDSDIARIWGELTTKLKKAGRTLTATDGLIAATAIHNGLRLMTRNTDDFQLTGVLLVNPCENM